MGDSTHGIYVDIFKLTVHTSLNSRETALPAGFLPPKAKRGDLTWSFFAENQRASETEFVVLRIKRPVDSE